MEAARQVLKQNANMSNTVHLYIIFTQQDLGLSKVPTVVLQVTHAGVVCITTPLNKAVPRLSCHAWHPQTSSLPSNYHMTTGRNNILVTQSLTTDTLWLPITCMSITVPSLALSIS